MKKCECTLAEKLVGDGCEVCNPSLALEYAQDTIADLEKENATFRDLVEEFLSFPTVINTDEEIEKHKVLRTLAKHVLRRSEND